jgi:hypothetical protein
MKTTTTSSLWDENLGRDHAMSDGVREVNLLGCHVAKGIAIGQRRPEKLRKDITFKLELDFGKGFSRWKDIS